MTILNVSRGNYVAYDALIKIGGVFDTEGTNIKLGGGDLEEVDDINFNIAGQNITTNTLGIDIELPTGDVLDIEINVTSEYTFGAAEADYHNNDIDNMGTLKFASTSAISGSDVGFSGLTGDLYANFQTNDSMFIRENGSTVVEIDGDGIDIRVGFLEGTEITAPAGLANHGRFFYEDNGAGKTRAMIQFGTGAAQQVAIEP